MLLLSFVITLLLVNNILTLNQYIDNQYNFINIIKYPLLFAIYTFIVLIEAGRIPVDLIESESELISGYSMNIVDFYMLYLPLNKKIAVTIIEVIDG